jgi:hypothetical protein
MSLENKIISLLNAIVRRTYWFNNVAFPDCKKFWVHKTFNLDIINLGSSSAKAAFDYSGYNIKTANWAMAPQTFVGDLEILRNYCCYLKHEGAIVLISICPFSSLGGSSDCLPDKYYTILNIASFPHASFRKQQEILDMQRNSFKYYPLIELYYGIRRKLYRVKDVMDTVSLEKDAEQRMISWMKEFSITDYSNPLSLVNQDAYEDGIFILNKIISFCVVRGLKPVIVLPPVTEALSSKITKEMREQFIYSFVNKANSEKIPFLDYFEDEEFKDPSLFRDSFLLNRKGAQCFTKRVLSDLNLLY